MMAMKTTAAISHIVMQSGDIGDELVMFRALAFSILLVGFCCFWLLFPKNKNILKSTE